MELSLEFGHPPLVLGTRSKKTVVIQHFIVFKEKNTYIDEFL
jgi:hypothetical protein